MLDELNGERVVDEYLMDHSRLEANKEAFTIRGASNNFDVSNHAVKDPFSLLNTGEAI